MKVYMIGIGGASMSGLCEILLEKDMCVCGSDSGGAPYLESLGVKVYKTHSEKNIPAGTQIVVYSSAISAENPELKYARENHICTFSRGELLGLISRGFEKVVAVSGSHGKTTTTAMIGEIFAFAGLFATLHIGGENARKKCGNGGDIFLCEACEYCDNFLFLSPTVGVILNVEYDHPDYFKTAVQQNKSFEKFAHSSEFVVTSKAVASKVDIPKGVFCEVLVCDATSLEFSQNPPDFSARNLKSEKGKFAFDFYKKNSFICEIQLKILGRFNVENALFACVVGYLFGATPFEIQKGISGFFGVKRRLEQIGFANGCEIFCDYAHHPTQVLGISEIFGSETLVIFQPHTYSRTKAMLKEFVVALSGFENLIITQTYPAREKFDYLGSGEHLCSNLQNAEFVSKDKLEKRLETADFQRVLFLGAGDIHQIARDYVLANK
ncbi:MAG: Mur ligase domain-containing protein [Bacillota bacterium]